MSELKHVLLTGVDRFPPSALPALPALQRALQHWQTQPLLTQANDAPLTLAEHLQAQLLQLPGEPGHQPLAALAHGIAGEPCAWLTPCHVQLGMDRAQLHDPAELNLGDTESRTLMSAIAPLFADEGVTLHYKFSLRWLAQGELLRDAYSVSLAQATRAMLRHDMLTPAAASQSDGTRRRLMRLRNEVEMLLYTHPITDARAAQRLPAINAVWLHGAGALPQAFVMPAPTANDQVQIDARLDQAAEQGQAAWQAAWQTLDAELPATLMRLRTVPTASVVLCGETRAQGLAPAASGIGQRLARWLQPVRLSALLQTLTDPAPAGDRHAL